MPVDHAAAPRNSKIPDRVKLAAARVAIAVTAVAPSARLKILVILGQRDTRPVDTSTARRAGSAIRCVRVAVDPCADVTAVDDDARQDLVTGNAESLELSLEWPLRPRPGLRVPSAQVMVAVDAIALRPASTVLSGGVMLFLALLVPVAFVGLAFALDAFETFLFPAPSRASVEGAPPERSESLPGQER